MHRSRPFVAAVVFVLVLEIAVSLLLRVNPLAAPGPPTWRFVVAAFGLVVLAVLAASVFELTRRFRRLEASLLEREEQLTADAATSHDWLWQTTPEAVITYSSAASFDLLGFPPETLVGRCLFELMDDTDVARARAVSAEVVAAGGGWADQESRWRHADGHPVILVGSGVPLFSQAGAVIAFRGTRRVVTTSAAERNGRSAVRDRVDAVLARRGLSVAFQPIVELASGRCRGIEALARFDDNRAPDQWFADAHAADRGVELELLAIEIALSHLDAFPAPTRLSINASPTTILDHRFSELLHQHPIGRLTVEITEHAVIARYDDLHAALAPLRAAGLLIAVDDTGAGYASFSHVLQLRPDEIKLDRSWLSGIETDAARRTLVTAGVLLALDLGASVTAEGVETWDQLQALAGLGVDHVQGYLLDRPTVDGASWRTWTEHRWTNLGVFTPFGLGCEPARRLPTG